MLNFSRCTDRDEAFNGFFCFNRQLGVWLDKAFSLIKECPRYLVPCYFDAIITPLYLKLLDRAWSQMSRFANAFVVSFF